MNRIDLKDSMLRAIFSEREFADFRTLMCDIGSSFPDVRGVLVTGSLVQKVQLPAPPDVVEHKTDLAKAYAQIVGRTKRKIFPHADSDLDMWVLTNEQDGNENVADKLAERGLDLLEWYARQGDVVDLNKWVELKRKAFDEMYKKDFLYSARWRSQNPYPAHAEGFTKRVEEKVERLLPGVSAKVDYYFRKNFHGGFIETRAFPRSVFNLKTERIMRADSEDRTPFPFYIKDWVDLEKNCIVVYRADPSGDRTYPFDAKGIVPGESIAKAIGWTQKDIDAVLFRREKKHD